MKKLSIEVVLVGKGAISTNIKQDDVFDINDDACFGCIEDLLWDITGEISDIRNLDTSIVSDDEVSSAVAECWNMPLTLVISENEGKYSHEIIHDQTMNKYGRKILLRCLMSAITSYPITRHAC